MCFHKSDYYPYILSQILLMIEVVTLTMPKAPFLQKKPGKTNVAIKCRIKDI